MSPSSPLADHAAGVDSSTPLSSPLTPGREITELHELPIDGSINGSGIRSGQANGERQRSERLSALKKFWRGQIIAVVPHEARRDHFGTLFF